MEPDLADRQYWHCRPVGSACTLLQWVITLPAWAGPQEWLDLAPDPLSPEMRLLEGAGLLLFLPLSVFLILRVLIWDYTVMNQAPILTSSMYHQRIKSILCIAHASKVDCVSQLSLCSS